MDEAVPLLAALVGRVDRDELAGILLATFQDEIPGYARLPEAVVQGQVLDVIRQNVDLCLDWVAGGGPPNASRFDEFRTSAKNRATEGMPLEDLLRAYRIGGTAAWRFLASEATDEERGALPHAAELVMEYLDRVSGIVASAYMDERQHLVSEQERGMRALFDALLDGAPLDPSHHETAERVGFPLGAKAFAFALALPGEGATAHARTAAALRLTGALALTEGDRVVGLAAPEHVPGSALPAAAVAVVDDPVGREELAASAADVRLGIEIAVRAGRTGVVELRELALDLLLARSPRVAAELRRRILSPLAPQHGGARGDLLKTVATYVELHRDRQETAERLHIHPNTLDHRLRRARELTGLDLDDPEDLATMVLALHEPLG
jgi:hypothetical protein